MNEARNAERCAAPRGSWQRMCAGRRRRGAAHACSCARIFEGNADVVVPAIVWPLTSRRVIPPLTATRRQHAAHMHNDLPV